jgi:hypothetical protein
MDEVGLRELVRTGVKVAARKWKIDVRDANAFAGTDSEIVTVIDRLAQLGLIALDYKQPRAWTEAVEGLLNVYKLGVDETSGYHLPMRNTWLLIDVVQRVLLLGAAAVRTKRFDHVRELTLQRPLDNRPKEYWIRFAVTMASRGQVNEAFKGKSLIGPASESVRERPQFFGAFDENLDKVVNSMCQYDFLHCVVALAEAKERGACYPNFGGYYGYRTMPIILDLIGKGQSRGVMSGIAEEELAEILRDLDELAKEQFFDVGGWEHYDRVVYDFIKAKLRKT